MLWPSKAVTKGRKACSAVLAVRVAQAPALSIKDPAEFHADNPAPVRLPFLAELLGTPALEDRVDQFNPIGINNGEYRGRSEKALTPALVGDQQAVQARAVG